MYNQKNNEIEFICFVMYEMSALYLIDNQINLNSTFLNEILANSDQLSLVVGFNKWVIFVIHISAHHKIKLLLVELDIILMTKQKYLDHIKKNAE